MSTFRDDPINDHVNFYTFIELNITYTHCDIISHSKHLQNVSFFLDIKSFWFFFFLNASIWCWLLFFFFTCKKNMLWKLLGATYFHFIAMILRCHGDFNRIFVWLPSPPPPSSSVTNQCTYIPMVMDKSGWNVIVILYKGNKIQLNWNEMKCVFWIEHSVHECVCVCVNVNEHKEREFIHTNTQHTMVTLDARCQWSDKDYISRFIMSVQCILQMNTSAIFPIAFTQITVEHKCVFFLHFKRFFQRFFSVLFFR